MPIFGSLPEQLSIETAEMEEALANLNDSEDILPVPDIHKSGSMSPVIEEINSSTRERSGRFTPVVFTGEAVSPAADLLQKVTFFNN